VDDLTEQADDDDALDIHESGLGIEDLKLGDGPGAKVGDVVEVHYVGRLVDGTVFDDSRARDEPLQFKVGDELMIKGWEEGIVGLKVGGLRKLIVPPHLGYGEHGYGSVPPNAMLEFELELLRLNPDEN
jgi:FKBP-type peptidyl-prolyl cis-trans isomerase